MLLSLETREIPIYQGEDRTRFYELIERVQTAARAVVPLMLDEEPETVRLAREYDEFVAEARERAVLVGVAPLPRRQWRDLVAACPPREGDEEDESYGFNVDALADALVPVSMTAPTFDSDAAKAEFLDRLTHADYQRIFTACYELNAGVVNPKVGMSSRIEQMYEPNSEPPAMLA